MKNYIGFVNDHSGSMASLRSAAMKDYNNTIEAIKNAATAEMMDTIVTVVGLGLNSNHNQLERQVTFSNPHVLHPKKGWPTQNSTPLWSAIREIIELHQAMVDIRNNDVSVLITVTTDGEATDGHMHTPLQNMMKPLLETGRWTFVFRVPKRTSYALQSKIRQLGVSQENILEWETTNEGMTQASAVTTQAVNAFYRSRATGQTSSNAFYANAANVNLAALEDITKKVSLYVVPPEDNGIEIRPFILRHRMEYLKGAAFYQLVKTEARVQPGKQFLIRDRQTGKIFGGKEARKMLNLPDQNNVRLHPGDHLNYDLFVQSSSVNRKLVGGSGVIYWKEIGVPFTEADLAYLKPKEAVAKPAVIELPKVNPTNKPTKSPIPVTPRSQFFETREDARQYCNAQGIPQKQIQRNKAAPKGRQWFV